MFGINSSTLFIKSWKCPENLLKIYSGCTQIWHPPVKVGGLLSFFVQEMGVSIFRIIFPRHLSTINIENFCGNHVANNPLLRSLKQESSFFLGDTLYFQGIARTRPDWDLDRQKILIEKYHWNRNEKYKIVNSFLRLMSNEYKRYSTLCSYIN